MAIPLASAVPLWRCSQPPSCRYSDTMIVLARARGCDVAGRALGIGIGAWQQLSIPSARGSHSRISSLDQPSRFILVTVKSQEMESECEGTELSTKEESVLAAMTRNPQKPSPVPVQPHPQYKEPG